MEGSRFNAYPVEEPTFVLSRARPEIAKATERLRGRQAVPRNDPAREFALRLAKTYFDCQLSEIVDARRDMVRQG
jgi:hypothetical protein